MAKENQSLRRRAAVAVLSSLLEEDTLLQELWSLQTSLRGDSVSDIIECVDGLAQRHLFDAGTRKRLYADFFKALRAPEDSLPLDPWPMMQAMRPQPAAAPLMPPVAPVAAPVAAPLSWNQPGYVPPSLSVPVAVLAQPLPVPVPVAAPAAAPVAPFAAEPTAIFGATMRALVSELSTAHREAMDEVRNDAMRALAGNRASVDVREQYGRAWDRALSHDWKLHGPTEDLVGLMQLTHGALVLAFGRVGADQIVGRAMTEAAKLPEALRYAPRLLMGA